MATLLYTTFMTSVYKTTASTRFGKLKVNCSYNSKNNSKNNSKVIEISRRTKNDIEKQIQRKMQNAENNCIQNRNHECYVIWKDIRNLNNRSKSLDNIINDMEYEEYSQIEDDNYFFEHFEFK
jgi:hypothetical protein